jgi:CheY-like chemotaxis protein
MPARHKILLLDDDQDLLELYKEILGRLPSKPEIHTASSGARAISMLESEPFTLLISDLSMPKMDGLQVLAIVRRRFPQLRTAVFTSVSDEQFRARAYAIGVDVFLEKPSTTQEIDLFLDCIESLLGREEQGGGGFRGVQSKSLVDIIQLECLSQSSSVLKVTNSLQEGRIWFQNGDVIDAATQDLTGEAAFKKIFSWRTGNFEILPPEPERPRTIVNSSQGLLLDSAQAVDEAKAADAGMSDVPAERAQTAAASSSLAEAGRMEGVEFVVTALAKDPAKIESWSVENADQLAKWAHSTYQGFLVLGEKLQAGQLSQIEGLGLQRNVAVAARGDTEFCVGFHRSTKPEQIRATLKNILAKWAS